ncbi:MAG: hypothetical protein EOO53_15155 [Gammaproteobacteria bacterium]|nr:MAG: hypothetical protein EOO53_15155 [Gammaproteobacteria bacterium]
MSTLLQKIATQQAKLENNVLCQHLVHRRDSSAAAYSFLPHMTFFILGFRDILEEARIKNPKSDVELALNAHCDEDSGHWLWFIEDLKTLNMDVNYWGGDMSSILKMLWSPESYPVRELVYRITNHIRTSKTAEEKMIIVDCMESTFSVFINSLNVITHRNGFYNKLKFFGSEHFDAESNHASGNWLEGEKQHDDDHSHYSNIQLFRLSHMSFVIDDIFNGFDQVFNYWYNTMQNAMPNDVGIAI